jgi:light-regulated signal transduction histidine kinase (bacteriophytochrome)
VVHALAHQEKKLGVVLFEFGDDVSLAGVLEFLRMKISVTLQYILMFEEIVTQARHLEVVNKDLEHSNRALQEFAYVASHDLQEPLRKIVTFGGRLSGRLSDTLDEQSMDYLMRMQNAASRMQKLIESLLSYSRVTTMAKPFKTVDLANIMRAVLSDLEVRIEKLEARVEIMPLPVIEADPTQMHQLFLNLIQNALKFRKPGVTPRVKVYALPPEEDNNQTIVVEDNGIGIEPRHIDKIFGVFKRLHGRDEYEGSGIGLAICRKIMDRHGGVIRVESELGEWTRFIMAFSLERDTVNTEERE